MAMVLNAGTFSRSEVFLIDPKEIQVSEASNGRWLPHDEESVLQLVRSYEESGQLQPVTVRKIEGNRVELVIGYRRLMACKRFNELHPDKPMKLRCQVSKLTDEESLVRNIEENRERRATSAVDDAHNQERLRTGYQWSDTRIATHYRVTPSYVSQLKKFLGLSRETQLLVHKGELSVSAAMALAELPAQQQAEIVASATTPVAGEPEQTPAKRKAAVSRAVKESVRVAEGRKGKTSRSMAEVRAFFEGVQRNKGKLKNLGELVIEFIDGDSTESSFKGQLDSLLGA